MNKISIDDNYIKTSLKELDNNLSVVQMILLFVATLFSRAIGLNFYVTDLTRIIVAIIVSIIAVIYVHIELKNNLIENWNIKRFKNRFKQKEW